jgi:hypothetical protein
MVQTILRSIFLSYHSIGERPSLVCVVRYRNRTVILPNRTMKRFLVIQDLAMCQHDFLYSNKNVMHPDESLPSDALPSNALLSDGDAAVARLICT